MDTLYVILLILAAVCFLVAAFRASMRGVDGTPVRTIDLVALGLLFWVLVPLIQQIDSMN